jgi:hypothetical protein
VLQSIGDSMTISSSRDQHRARARTSVAISDTVDAKATGTSCTSVCRVVQNRTPTIADAHR